MLSSIAIVAPALRSALIGEQRATLAPSPIRRVLTTLTITTHPPQRHIPRNTAASRYDVEPDHDADPLRAVSTPPNPSESALTRRRPRQLALLFSFE